ncbi:FAD-binding protein [Adlercreutzia caecimuris]|uniref:FAD-dependent oxidoreductase n=1 Tax=Adlercreutzia caecimuris TaxID=671266 RepID=UPI0013733365|nr:FAD-binding protein [Adlercreutzia caecimuris]NBJ65837.1 FAD-binding protein [Adlercreutzia caecimuris]
MGKTQGEKEMRSIDRRSFFKLGGLTAGAAALTGGMLAGCAPQSQTDMAATGGENETVDAAVPYAVFDTDILVIGAGYGASFAMQEACKAGQNMLVIDKAPYGFGGAFGMNFDIMNTWVPGAFYETEEEVPVATKIRNGSLYRKTGVQNEVELNPDVVCANWGEILSARNEDGTPFYIYDFPTTRGFEHSMTRHWSDHFRAKDYITVHDRTMITDLIIEGGRCLGAVGLHIPTGEYRVYRAKVTLTATGGCTQFYGWNSTSPTTNNVCDNTADVEMALLRHGGKIANAEFGSYDMMGAFPRSFAASEGSMVGADSVHSGDLMDSEGTYLKDYPEIAEKEYLATQSGVMQAVDVVVRAGKGSERGGVYLDCKEESLATMRWMYQRNAQLLKEKFGYDFTAQPTEVVPEMYEHGGEPITDDNAMCVDAEGLFCVRANAGSEGGMMNITNRRMGRYAMKKALEYLATYEEPASVTYEGVAAEIARLEDLRTRTVDDPLRPITVRRNIQHACAEAGRPVRPADVLETAKAELDRIMAEDLPRMACADDSLVQNADWKDAIEVVNLLDIARLTVEASLAREESRDAFIRPDFPEPDDANWKCALAYTRAEDGSLSYEKIAY